MSNGDGQENRQEQGGVKSQLVMSMNLENSGRETAQKQSLHSHSSKWAGAPGKGHRSI